jgi:hypothetical protein
MGNIKVFGIGLNKTGTTTLGRCFATLGYRHASVSRDLLIDWHNGILNRIKAVCDTHDSFEDWPYPLLFEKLFDWYGDSARYILTVRSSPLAWIRSLKNHSLKTHPTQHSRLIAYGYAYPHGLEQQHIAKYEDHNRKVRDFFVKRGLDHLLTVLCWESGDRWETLCSFLHEPVPNLPFPHEGRTNMDAIRHSPFFDENCRYIRNQLELLGIEYSPALIE